MTKLLRAFHAPVDCDIAKGQKNKNLYEKEHDKPPWLTAVAVRDTNFKLYSKNMKMSILWKNMPLQKDVLAVELSYEEKNKSNSF
jgi:hypothetical protein